MQQHAADSHERVDKAEGNGKLSFIKPDMLEHAIEEIEDEIIGLSRSLGIKTWLKSRRAMKEEQKTERNALQNRVKKFIKEMEKAPANVV